MSCKSRQLVYRTLYWQYVVNELIDRNQQQVKCGYFQDNSASRLQQQQENTTEEKMKLV